MDIKARFRNKIWVMSLISAVLLIVKLVSNQAGIVYNEGFINDLVNGILSLLTILGVFINGTTEGLQD